MCAGNAVLFDHARGRTMPCAQLEKIRQRSLSHGPYHTYDPPSPQTHPKSQRLPSGDVSMYRVVFEQSGVWARFFKLLREDDREMRGLMIIYIHDILTLGNVAGEFRI
eukprot:6342383-Amphidinium_carterae.1